MEPTTIKDAPIPLIAGGETPSLGSNTDSVVADSGAYLPNTHIDTKFPQVNVAQETISQSINTETKKILGEYTFEQNGAIAIGKFSQGVSGEIDISPVGIVARNVNGDSTFSLNAATGDAIFKGTVEASGFVIADETGLHSVNNFPSDSVSDGANFNTTSATYVDITGITLTTTNLPRSVKILINADADLKGIASGAGDYSGSTQVTINIDGAAFAVMTHFDKFDTASGIGTLTGVQTTSVHEFLEISAGIHTLKLQMKCTSIANFKAGGLNFRLSYVILGT